MLAVAARLGPLVPEVGPHVPGLERQRWPVLDPRPHDRRRPLGAQGQPAPALVLELVHLLAHHVGGLAHPLEHADVLEHGADHQAIAGPPGPVGEQGDQALPSGRLGGQDVARANRRLELRHRVEAN